MKPLLPMVCCPKALFSNDGVQLYVIVRHRSPNQEALKMGMRLKEMCDKCIWVKKWLNPNRSPATLSFLGGQTWIRVPSGEWKVSVRSGWCLLGAVCKCLQAGRGSEGAGPFTHFLTPFTWTPKSSKNVHFYWLSLTRKSHNLHRWQSGRLSALQPLADCGIFRMVERASM